MQNKVHDIKKALVILSLFLSYVPAEPGNAIDQEPAWISATLPRSKGLDGLKEWLALAKYGRKYAFIDTFGHVVRQFESPGFESFFSLHEGIVRIETYYNYGFIDSTGKTIANIRYDYASDFSQGLAAASRERKYGYIDQNGRFVIEPQFDQAGGFTENLAVASKGEKYGYIDQTGRFVIEPQFTYAGEFSEGLAAVKKDKAWGYIDRTGAFIIKPRFNQAGRFSSSRAWVLVDDDYCYIDADGRTIIKPDADEAYDFSGNRAKIGKGEKYGYLNRKGDIVVDLRFDECYDFSEGLARVKIDSLTGFIDTTGTFVIEPRFLRASDFHGRRALVDLRDRSTGARETGYIDRSGKLVAVFPLVRCGDFSEGKALIGFDNEKVNSAITELIKGLSKTEQRTALGMILKAMQDGSYFDLRPDYYTYMFSYEVPEMIYDNVHYKDDLSGTALLSIIDDYHEILERTCFSDHDSTNLEKLFRSFGECLRKIYQEESVAILLRFAADPTANIGLRVEMCQLAADMGIAGKFPMIVEMVSDFPDPKDKIYVLTATRDERAIPFILSLIDSADAQTKITAAANLKNFHSNQATRALIRLLQDRDPLVRREAILPLGVTGDEDAVAPLKTMLEDTVLQNRTNAAWSLWILGDKSGIPVLIKDHQFDDVLSMADPSIAEYILPLVMNDKDPPTQLSAAAILGACASRSAIDLLQQKRKTLADGPVKQEIILGLARLGDKSILPEFHKVIADSFYKIYFDASGLRWFFEIVDQSSIPVFHRILATKKGNHPDILDSVIVANYLARLDDTLGARIIRSQLKTRVPFVHESVLKHLGLTADDFLELVRIHKDRGEGFNALLHSFGPCITYNDIARIESGLAGIGLSASAQSKMNLLFGKLCQEARDYEKEENFARLAYEQAQATADNALILESLWLLSDAKVYTGDHKAAEGYLKDCLEICRRLVEKERDGKRIFLPEAYSHCLLGELCLKQKRYKEAFQHFSEARAEANRFFFEPGDVAFWIDFVFRQRDERERLIARIASGVGSAHAELSKESFREAVTGFEKAGTTNIREKESRDRAYHGLIRAAIADGNYEKAQRLTEELILIKLNEDFNRMEINPANPERKKEMEELTKRKREIAAMKNAVKGGGQNTVTDDDARDKNREFKKYINALKTNNPKLFTIVNSEPSNLKELQDNGIIPENMAIVQYLMAEEELYIFVVKADDLFIRRVAIDRIKLCGLIDEYRTLIKNPGNDAELAERASELYQYLISPLEPDLKGVEIIGIIPNQQLYYLGFSALKKKGAEDYLCDQYQIFYINSTSILGIIAQDQGCDLATAPFVAYANADNTLPAAENEVKEISGIYAQSLIFNQDQALKDSVLRTSGCKILQFATHGKAIPQTPTSSYLVLAPDGERGRLTVEEIWGLDLKHCPLVVLSACETAEGKLIAGDEVVSLAFGFIYAGSASCLATLWSVEDRSTAALMNLFHRNLKSGMNRSRALQAAQLETRKQYPSPFYWAPFILIGDWQ